MTSRLRAATQDLAQEISATSALGRQAGALQRRGGELRGLLAALPQPQSGPSPADLLAQTKVQAEAILKDHRRAIRRLHLRIFWQAIRWYVYAFLIGGALLWAAILTYPYYQAYQKEQARIALENRNRAAQPTEGAIQEDPDANLQNHLINGQLYGPPTAAQALSPPTVQGVAP